VSNFIDFTVSDAELEIKKRARRRLLGAVVIALVAVIVLPLALRNSEEPRSVPDMQVSIPERGESELSPDGRENDSESADTEVVIEPDAASDAPEPSVVDDTPSSLPEPSPAPQASVAPEQPASPPAARTPEEPRHSPSRPGTTQKEDAEVARVQALLDGKSPGATGVPGQVFIQVGAFGSTDRADRHVKELNDQGFAAYAEKAGKVTRVRIGPLPKSESEQVVARLKAKGYKTLVSPR
jgi:DedD protein